MPVERGEEDYTIFVHLLNGNGERVAGVDAPPRGGEYPTGLWEAGEVITDVRSLPLDGLSPGRYQLVVGMYAPDTLQRLPCYDSSGESIAGESIPLTGIEILPVRTRLYLPAFKEWGEPEPAPPEKTDRKRRPGRKKR